MPDFSDISQYISRRYGVAGDTPFSDGESVVFRHKNGKWFALAMRISKEKLRLPSAEKALILNLKCDPILSGDLRDGISVFPAYHMNKEHWITVRPETCDPNLLYFLIDRSYELTAPKPKKPKSRKG